MRRIDARAAYVLLLDPPESGVSAGATAKQATASEPRQDRPASQAATVQRRAAASRPPAPPQVAHAQASPVPAPTQVVHASGFAERSPSPPATAPELPVGERATRTGLVGPLALRQVASAPELVRPVAPLPPRVQSAPASANSGWYLVVAGIAAAGMIALLALLLHRRQSTPEIPQWTRSPPTSTRDRSPNSPSRPVRCRTPSRMPGRQRVQRGADSAGRRSAPPSRFGERRQREPHEYRCPIDPSTIDTLLDALDSDVIEERAVREAWAAARSDVEKEMDGNAILHAIEAAERDLHLAPPLPAQAAIERALEDDLLQPPQRR